jgi:hypothetical protein
VILVDANLLLYPPITDVGRHRPAQSWLGPTLNACETASSAERVRHFSRVGGLRQENPLAAI